MRTPRLWEALIALGIVGLLLVTLVQWLMVSCAPYGPRRRSSCLSNVKQIGLALKQYSQDYGDRYPWRVGATRPGEAWLDLGMLFPNYCSAIKTFFCPQSRDRMWDAATITDKISRPLDAFTWVKTTEVISYSYGIDARTDTPTGWTEEALSTVRLLADKKAGQRTDRRASHSDDGRNVLYQDGHVKWKAGPDALDPDEDSDEIGAPAKASYRKWWSDPPYYGE